MHHSPAMEGRDEKQPEDLKHYEKPDLIAFVKSLSDEECDKLIHFVKGMDEQEGGTT